MTAVPTGPPGAGVDEVRATLPPRPESARRARALLREALVRADRERWLDAAELALSEVVTNAALHAHTEIDLIVQVEERSVCVEVRDFSELLPVQRHYGEEAVTGRGMGLVAAVSDECGVHSLGDAGKVVWFRVGDQDPGTTTEAEADALLAAWDIDTWDVDEHTPAAGAEDPAAPDGAVPSEEATDAPAPVPPRAIVLREMPVMLWLAAREHHDAIIREFGYHCAAAGVDRFDDISAADHARGIISSTLVASVGVTAADWEERGAGLREGAAGWRSQTVDLTLVVPADGAAMFATLQDVLDAAEAQALEGFLLVRPALPEIVAVRDWACEQVIAQLAGVDPTPWPGAAQGRFETEVRAHPDDDVESWDRSSVTESARHAVAADEANRIVAVSRPLAELVGWAVDDLVGRRVTTLVPPALREAHVAGYSRHLTTGEVRILGVPLEVPILTADGREIPCRLQIDEVCTGPRIFVATFEPLDER